MPSRALHDENFMLTASEADVGSQQNTLIERPLIRLTKNVNVSKFTFMV